MANDRDDDVGDFQHVIETINSSDLNELISSTSDNLICLVIMVMVMFSMILMVSGSEDSNSCKEYRLFRGCRFRSISVDR